jgi:hypothetical protein
LPAVKNAFPAIFFVFIVSAAGFMAQPTNGNYRHAVSLLPGLLLPKCSLKLAHIPLKISLRKT